MKKEYASVISLIMDFIAITCFIIAGIGIAKEELLRVVLGGVIGAFALNFSHYFDRKKVKNG